MITQRISSTEMLLLLVNKNVVSQEEVRQMGLSSCNVRCISTHIAKGKVLSKMNV